LHSTIGLREVLFQRSRFTGRFDVGIIISNPLAECPEERSEVSYIFLGKTQVSDGGR
jgi:hypothetical protein